MQVLGTRYRQTHNTTWDNNNLKNTTSNPNVFLLLCRYHPTITHDLVKKYAVLSTNNYKTVADHDIPKKDLFGEGQKPWTQDTGQLRFLCNINPMCVGYTSEGFLKNSTEGIQPKVGVTLYLKV